MSALYKIRSKKTGLFSTGGNSVAWSKFGKIWMAKAHLSNHFTGLTSLSRKEYREHEAEVVEVELVIKLAEPVQDFIDAAEQRKAARDARAKAVRESMQRREFERLLKKFDPTKHGGEI